MKVVDLGNVEFSKPSVGTLTASWTVPSSIKNKVDTSNFSVVLTYFYFAYNGHFEYVLYDSIYDASTGVFTKIIGIAKEVNATWIEKLTFKCIVFYID